MRDDSTAAAVVRDYVEAQVDVIEACRADLRDGARDSVHKTRVATRRLRSTLRTFRRLLRREAVDPLRAELGWFSAVLAHPRDAEVMRARILQALDSVDQSLVVDGARDRITEALDARRDAAQAALVAALDSDRFAAVTARLAHFRADPPWRGRASGKARTVLPTMVGGAVARVTREWALARESDGEEQLDRQHEARKRAKAVRYAFELLEPLLGAQAEAAAGRWEEVTEALGAVQDSRMTIRWIRETEPGFTGGVLVGMELARVEAARQDLPELLQDPDRMLDRLGLKA